MLIGLTTRANSRTPSPARNRSNKQSIISWLHSEDSRPSSKHNKCAASLRRCNAVADALEALGSVAHCFFCHASLLPHERPHVVWRGLAFVNVAWQYAQFAVMSRFAQRFAADSSPNFFRQPGLLQMVDLADRIGVNIDPHTWHGIGFIARSSPWCFA